MQEINNYISEQPEERRVVLSQLVSMIEAQAPDATASMKYKMPTFEREGYWVAVANQKHYVSVYTCQEDHIAGFKLKHPKVKTGKGCINFTRMDSVPYGDVVGVINNALALN